ncbi:MAG: SusC/RagA family TonB-linked outer membrane protein, partial [Bacteroidaceae bacterium]|nr:SusC/RagA family TonB-linked outer membrane protein [Bacteroidaceae bacterium]
GYGYHKDLLNAWTPTNTKTDIPRLNVGDSYHAYTSDRFLTNASYLNVANITLGYSFPKSILSKLYLSKLRIYAVGDNLITMSKRKGLNPRQSVTGGSSSLYYASMRTISAGVQIGF